MLPDILSNLDYTNISNLLKLPSSEIDRFTNDLNILFKLLNNYIDFCMN